MRPVNLIPPEDRRGDRAPLRTGALPYAIVGALAVALVLLTFMTLTGNQVEERKNEIVTLEARHADAAARAEALRPYAEFAALSESRDATVTSLAESRFDWERVLNELALVMPDNVWLTEAVGTVSPEVQIADAGAVEGRDEIVGPALELIGCATSHEAVAGFVAALEDIDGVTRVGVASSERVEPTTDSSSGASATAGTTDCRTRDSIPKFDIVAAFDAVPAPAAAAAPAVPGATPTPASTTPAATTTPPAEGAAAAPETQQSKDSAAQQTEKAQQATNLVPGVAR